jgi:hypothetical protein
MACLRLKVWDPAKGRMVGFAEADESAGVEEALIAK